MEPFGIGCVERLSAQCRHLPVDKPCRVGIPDPPAHATSPLRFSAAALFCAHFRGNLPRSDALFP